RARHGRAGLCANAGATVFDGETEAAAVYRSREVTVRAVDIHVRAGEGRAPPDQVPDAVGVAGVGAAEYRDRIGSRVAIRHGSALRRGVHVGTEHLTGVVDRPRDREASAGDLDDLGRGDVGPRHGYRRCADGLDGARRAAGSHRQIERRAEVRGLAGHGPPVLAFQGRRAVTPESFLHAAPDATSTSTVALRSRLTSRMGMPSFVESVIRRSRGARATKRESGESEATLPLPKKTETGRVDPSHSAGLAICPPRGMGDPHDSAPRGSWHLSCVPICDPTGRAPAR